MLLLCMSAALISYVLIGYPVLLSYLSKKHARPARLPQNGALQTRPFVSVLIPVHNGAHFLRRKLDSILAAEYPKHLLEILVISDGSTDETGQVAMEYAARGVELLQMQRSGKAAALNSAVYRTKGEILVLTDARQELDPKSLSYLIDAFGDPDVGVVSGELLLRSGTTQGEADIGFYWKYESWIRRNLSALDSMFGATGPFYAIRRALFTTIPEDILLDDMYLPMTAFFQGYRLIVEPRALAYDFPMTREREFNRKVRTLGGNYQLLYRMPRLLTRDNRLLWHFLSYKVGRLLLPWFTLLFVLSILTVPRPWNWLVAVAQICFCILAILDPCISEQWLLKKLSSPARTFVVLMIATIKGLQILFVAPRTLWKVTDIASDS